MLLASFTEIDWGFFAHRLINKMAVFTLPEEMFGFYKHHLEYLSENAVNPDRRRYIMPAEAPRHYIDLDSYGDSAIHQLPRYWADAVSQLSEDTLQAYGIVPWHINFMSYQLTEAFRVGDPERILRLSADLGHYVGDAHVPLHTTSNYDGQKTRQVGIHAFWESRLPELYSNGYDFFVGKAVYISNPQEAAWNAVQGAHAALDSVLGFEKQLSADFREDQKYSIEDRGFGVARVYSRDFSKAYHDMLDGMVERQMRASIKLTGDLWYTCWVNAGQPDLDCLIGMEPDQTAIKLRKEEIKKWKEQQYKPQRSEVDGGN